MQSDDIRQAHAVVDFMAAARRYFGLAPAAPSMSRRGGPYARLRPVFRSLLVVGSLGTVLAQPVFAMETMRSASARDVAKSSTKREASTLWVGGALAPAEKPSRD